MAKLPKPCIVDTNVAIVANEKSEQAPVDLIIRCIEAIQSITAQGQIALDESGLIFEEYRHKLSLAGQPGTGDLFMKWVHDNQWNPAYCERREIHCSNETEQVFDEFPTDAGLAEFDISDRKFVAVANAGAKKIPILQAVDDKWWGWKDALAKCGIQVLFLDPNAAERGYKSKMQT